MAFKRSAVRSRLSPPKNTRFHLKSSVFFILFSLFCTGRFRLGQQLDNRPSQFLFCNIYIYFSVLCRIVIYGLRRCKSVCHKVIAAGRIVFLCRRGASWCFVEIIGIAVPALDEIAPIYQLGEVVAVCRLRYSHRLPYGSGRERKQIAVGIGRKVQVNSRAHKYGWQPYAR